MGFAALKKTFNRVQTQTPFLLDINSQDDYDKASALMFELIDDGYEDNRLFIDVLASAIEKYEDTLSGVIDLEKRIADMDPALSMLRLLMDQHQLKGADLPEIGGKSLVSRILNGERQLTRQHIAALSKRFDIDPALFF